MDYKLRVKLNELVHLGLLDRAEYYSLVELLAEAPRLMPQHADDVPQAERLINRLVDLVQLVQEHGPAVVVPARQAEGKVRHIGIIGHGPVLAHAMSQLQEAQRVLGDNHVFTPLDTSHFVEPRPGSNPHNSIPEGQLFTSELGVNDMSRPAPEFYRGPIRATISFSLRDIPPEPVKNFPKPKFNGYMGKGKHGKYQRPT